MDLSPREILETLLSTLGFTFEIKERRMENGAIRLDVTSPEANRLIGQEGQTLEDLQFLLNRFIQVKEHSHADQSESPSPANRIVVDVNQYRANQEQDFLSYIKEVGDQVRQENRSITLEPMNSFQRRLVHNLFKDDPKVGSQSVEGEGRFKEITLYPR